MIPLMMLLLSASARAEDWPQFLGPRRDGTSKEVIAPWSGEPRVVWRVPVGEGHSSPVVAGGFVFLHDKVPDADAERLSAFDAADGKLLTHAEQPRAKFSSLFGVGPAATPAVADGIAYALGITGNLSAVHVRREGGEVSLRHVFGKDLLKEFEADNLKFGTTASPLVEGDLVITLVGGKGAGVVAFNRKVGEVAWKALDDPASYASPTAIGDGANRQIIVLTKLGLASLSPRDGSVFWQFPFRDRINESSTTPVKVGDMLVASSVTLGGVGLKLTEKRGKPAVEEAWRQLELTCYFSTPVAVGKDHVYMVTGGLSLRPTITLRCVEVATGKTLWSKPNVGKYHAALVKTGDDKLLMLDDGGHLTLIQPDAKEFRVLARSKVCGETWAHPAVAGGRVFLRDAKELICLEPGGGRQ
jgi:outer membrane protein assembly factor BamB